MPTIEQVSKRVFSDSAWLKKFAIGAVLSIIPIVNILALGYLYQVFEMGKKGKELTLPEWDDLKLLAIDGLRFLIVGLIFAALPVGLVVVCANVAFHGFVAQLPVIPVAFLAGPVLSAALYLYMVKRDLADCFNIDALGLMIRGAAVHFVVPTLAYLGLCLLGWVLIPLAFFFGGVFYFYLMAYAFRDLEKRAR